MRRLIRSLVPAPLREAFREWRALTPSQRRQWARLRLSADGLDALPPGLRAESRIVFVCYGNVFRSPMAEALFAAELDRRGMPSAQVSSAGLEATDGREAHEKAQDVARTMGVSLDAHRARRLTPEIVAASDLVVLMDRMNVAVYRDRFAGAGTHAIMLGAFDPDVRRRGMAIADPYGRPREEVVACYARVERSVRELSRRLIERG